MNPRDLKYEIGFNDVTYTDCNEKTKFSPDMAADAVIERFDLVQDGSSIWQYDNGVYRPDGEIVVNQTLDRVAKDMYNIHATRETIHKIRIRTPRIDRFNPDPYLFGVSNGVVDLRTGDVRDYTREDLITLRSPIKYFEDAECPNIEKFFNEIAEHPDDVKVLIDLFVAAAISKSMRKFYALIGSGKNGKGVLQKLINSFFGADQITSVQLATLNKNVFAYGNICNKRIISNGEVQVTKLESENIKRITGGDLIWTDVKNKNALQFYPFAIPIFDTNNPPKFRDTSGGFKERMISLNFPYQFVTNPDPNNPREKKRDMDLSEKLTTPQELAGLLNWIIRRAPEMIKEGEPYRRLGEEETASRYDKQSHTVISFFEDFTEYDTSGWSQNEGGFVPTKYLYKFYAEYCANLGVGAESERSFGLFMGKRGLNLRGGRKRGIVDPGTGKVNNDQLSGFFCVYFKYLKFIHAIPTSKLLPMEPIRSVQDEIEAIA